MEGPAFDDATAPPQLVGRKSVHKSGLLACFARDAASVTMSDQQQSSSYTSYSSVSYSSSSNVNGEQVSGARHTHTSHSDGSGTTVTSTSQNLGQPAVHEERHYDPQGRELIGGSNDTSRRIEDG